MSSSNGVAIVLARSESREGRSAFDAMPRLLRERGVPIVGAELLDSREQLVKAVRRAMKSKIRRIVICGGDGTQTSVVPHFAKRRYTLCVVPAGTGNSFALGLGIDSFESAADAVAFGSERRVDLGVVNGTYFANFLTVGLSAQVANETPRSLKSIVGPAAYAVSAVVPLLLHRPFRADIRWKRHRVRSKTHQIILANGRFYGHTPLSKDATLSDGRITVFVRDRTSTMSVVQTYVALLRGAQANLSGVDLWSTSKTIRLKTKPKTPVSVDGCEFGNTPIRIRVARRALRVMVPACTQAHTP
ncbi:MAG: YegS/Rv2252/BmrU family lipid kinase [Candidatus Eremiobacteraeota bacterium]|nr:YegS/Rv2252/BmrU family lipid kinase [Candidatus Eremiobacteraeota bacterium]